MNRISVVYGGALVVLSAVHLLAAQRNGLLAISQVFAPHLFLPLAVLFPLTLARGGSAARATVVAAVVVGLMRFGPGMVSLPAAPAAGVHRLSVFSWNLAAGQAAGDVLVDRLLASEAEIVGLQEVGPEHVAAIEANAELMRRYPYRIVQPEDGVRGMALLSRHPVVDSKTSREPPLIVAAVRLAENRTITVATAHPLPAQIRLVGGILPVAYDASGRDASLAKVRSAVDEAGAGPVVLLGDFNVTDREPGYSELAAGLIDAHASVGIGPGSTWRPPTLDFLPFGVLRIDYALAGGGVRPSSIGVDCVPNAGDHCIVRAVLDVP